MEQSQIVQRPCNREELGFENGVESVLLGNGFCLEKPYIRLERELRAQLYKA